MIVVTTDMMKDPHVSICRTHLLTRDIYTIRYYESTLVEKSETCVGTGVNYITTVEGPACMCENGMHRECRVLISSTNVGTCEYKKIKIHKY